MPLWGGKEGCFSFAASGEKSCLCPEGVKCSKAQASLSCIAGEYLTVVSGFSFQNKSKNDSWAENC